MSSIPVTVPHHTSLPNKKRPKNWVSKLENRAETCSLLHHTRYTALCTNQLVTGRNRDCWPVSASGMNRDLKKQSATFLFYFQHTFALQVSRQIIASVSHFRALEAVPEPGAPVVPRTRGGLAIPCRFNLLGSVTEIHALDEVAFNK